MPLSTKKRNSFLGVLSFFCGLISFPLHCLVGIELWVQDGLVIIIYGLVISSTILIGTIAGIKGLLEQNQKRFFPFMGTTLSIVNIVISISLLSATIAYLQLNN
tara:strand:- start:144 stop:455 length:312 start_codon:yes stop_codon:yes gene_type:complete